MSCLLPRLLLFRSYGLLVFRPVTPTECRQSRKNLWHMVGYCQRCPGQRVLIFRCIFLVCLYPLIPLTCLLLFRANIGNGVSLKLVPRIKNTHEMWRYLWTIVKMRVTFNDLVNGIKPFWRPGSIQDIFKVGLRVSRTFVKSLSKDLVRASVTSRERHLCFLCDFVIFTLATKFRIWVCLGSSLLPYSIWSPNMIPIRKLVVYRKESEKRLLV